MPQCTAKGFKVVFILILNLCRVMTRPVKQGCFTSVSSSMSTKTPPIGGFRRFFMPAKLSIRARQTLETSQTFGGSHSLPPEKSEFDSRKTGGTG